MAKFNPFGNKPTSFEQTISHNNEWSIKESSFFKKDKNDSYDAIVNFKKV